MSVQLMFSVQDANICMHKRCGPSFAVSPFVFVSSWATKQPSSSGRAPVHAIIACGERLRKLTSRHVDHSKVSNREPPVRCCRDQLPSCPLDMVCNMSNGS
jgi:hypothetical protein